jgi:arginine:ornithine antiporter/lysine permease
VQIFLIITLYANSTYLALFYIASTAILVPYVLSGAYALKLAMTGEGYAPTEGNGWDMFVGLVATVYGAWLIYAAGPKYLLMCALLYAPGILVYGWARNVRGEKAFSTIDVAIAAAIVLAAGFAGYMMWTGALSAL